MWGGHSIIIFIHPIQFSFTEPRINTVFFQSELLHWGYVPLPAGSILHLVVWKYLAHRLSSGFAFSNGFGFYRLTVLRLLLDSMLASYCPRLRNVLGPIRVSPWRFWHLTSRIHIPYRCVGVFSPSTQLKPSSFQMVFGFSRLTVLSLLLFLDSVDLASLWYSV